MKKMIVISSILIPLVSFTSVVTYAQSVVEKKIADETGLEEDQFVEFSVKVSRPASPVEPKAPETAEAKIAMNRQVIDKQIAECKGELKEIVRDAETSLKNIGEEPKLKEKEAARNKASEEIAKKKAEKEMARKKAEEEIAKKKSEKEIAKKRAEEEKAAKKAVEEKMIAERKAAEAKRAADRKAAQGIDAKAKLEARKKAEEEIAKKKAEKEIAKKKAAEEMAAKKTEKEIARKKAEEEKAAKRSVEEKLAAAERKAAEEISRQKAAQGTAAKVQASPAVQAKESSGGAGGSVTEQIITSIPQTSAVTVQAGAGYERPAPPAPSTVGEEVSAAYREAVALYWDGRYSEAKTKFEQVQKASGEYARTNYYLGRVKEKLNK